MELSGFSFSWGIFFCFGERRRFSGGSGREGRTAVCFCLFVACVFCR